MEISCKANSFTLYRMLLEIFHSDHNVTASLCFSVCWDVVMQGMYSVSLSRQMYRGSVASGVKWERHRWCSKLLLGFIMIFVSEHQLLLPKMFPPPFEVGRGRFLAQVTRLGGVMVKREYPLRVWEVGDSSSTKS